MAYKDPEQKRAYDRAYYQQHREEIIARAREHQTEHAEDRAVYMQTYAEEHREEIRTYHREWSARNTEKIRAYAEPRREQDRRKRSQKYLEDREAHHRKNAAYYAANREKIIEASARYAAEHPEKVREWRANGYRRRGNRYIAHNRSRRARKAQAAIRDFTHAQWMAMQEVYNHMCVYCDKRAKGHLTQDHITPLSKGGNHTLSNIVPACKSCNSRKSNRDVLTPVQPMLLLA